MRGTINDEYFEWLFDTVCEGRYSRRISYRKLLMRLHDIEFTYLLPMDRNRAEDGADLRRRFILMLGHEEFYDRIIEDLDGPCSVLEMMVALAIRCEDWMDDPQMGDRTGQWFWEMIGSLGLGGQKDGYYDPEFVDDKISIFLNRDYSPDGKGGLFTIKNCEFDLRTAEIWHQLCWYLDTMN